MEPGTIFRITSNTSSHRFELGQLVYLQSYINGRGYGSIAEYKETLDRWGDTVSIPLDWYCYYCDNGSEILSIDHWWVLKRDVEIIDDKKAVELYKTDQFAFYKHFDDLIALMKL